MSEAVLTTPVLVLNKSYQPIAVAQAGRALSLLFAGVVKALDENCQAWDFDDWSTLAAREGDGVINTPTKVLRVPAVVVAQSFNKIPRTRVRLSRQNVYQRDQFTCQYCGVEGTRATLNLDHVVPRSQGGQTSFENLVCSCFGCNSKKRDRTPEQAGMPLLKKPTRPTWQDLSPRKGSPLRVTPKEWLPFVDGASAAYWNVELKD
jgi:5-methylcytosine-specific restriction endonuclease McrA